MELKSKKKISFIIIGIHFFLGGVEYAVILPTAWEYLTIHFGSKPYKFGLLLSSFFLSGLVAAPFMGLCSDRMKNTKYIFIFANFWEIGGSLLYFSANSDWLLILSRLIAGVGTGVGAALFADITRVTSTDERTGLISMFMACRQVGTIAGPGFNLILRNFDIHYHHFVLNKFNAPGIFMAVLWILLQISVIFFYCDLQWLVDKQRNNLLKRDIDYASNSYDYSPLPESSSQPNVVNDIDSPDGYYAHITGVKRLNTENENSIRHRSDNLLTSSNEMIENAENWMSSVSNEYRPLNALPLDTEQNSEQNYKQLYNQKSLHNENSFPSSARRIQQNGINIDINNDETDIKIASNSKCTYVYNEYMREEVIAVLMSCFVALFDQSTLETIITPLTYNLLDWQDVENSILFCVCGLEICIVFFVIKFASKKFSDRQMLVFGFVLDTITNIFMLSYIPTAKPNNFTFNFTVLILGIFFNLVSIPIIIVSCMSLLSKVTSQEHQGSVQGVRRVFSGFGSLVGPLWAGGLLSVNNQNSSKCYILIGVLVGLMVITLVMISLSYGKMKEPSNTNTSQKRDQQERNKDIPNERTALITA